MVDKNTLVVVTLFVLGLIGFALTAGLEIALSIGIVSLMAIAIAAVCAHLTKESSERLDRYNIEGGWRSLVGKD